MESFKVDHEKFTCMDESESSDVENHFKPQSKRKAKRIETTEMPDLTKTLRASMEQDS